MRHQAIALPRAVAFGTRYTLLRRLAVGGMAEIYLARQDAMAGFEKEVVIKCLRPELVDDPRIVEMFLDEARIGALLNHPNIVHVYDVDNYDGIPYIAMEYIVGEELNELCRRGLACGKFLPLAHAVELIRQAAFGMGYFHAKRAAAESALAGQALEIVHCDISPSNLLVTQDGILKVIDFGIAKARGQRFRSESAIPGKLSYMSPEQATRQPVDHRSDIFSLGIVLYEITVGKRLFRGNATEIVSRLTAGEIPPPTFVRQDYPPALEAIVLRALERHPHDRYQNAYDLADDLEAYLRDQQLSSGPVQIARYLDELAAASGGARRPELQVASPGAVAGTELDFDSGMFNAFAPRDLAPVRTPVPEWEDLPEREDEVAAALGMELAELQAMRTPVPGRSALGEPLDRSVVRSGADDGAPNRPSSQTGASHDTKRTAADATAHASATNGAATPAPADSHAAEEPTADAAASSRDAVRPSSARPSRAPDTHAHGQGAPWAMVWVLVVVALVLIILLVVQ